MSLRTRKIVGEGFEYPVELHEDFSAIPEKLQSLGKISKIFVCTNREIAGIYEKYLVKELKKLGIPFHFIYLKPGEKNKHIDRVKKVYHELIKEEADRNSLLIAFGGGVIGDFVGFIAATFLRGVRFVQIPTTLLACVDSSVGGKVAVNVDLGKNMVGAFYQPQFVYAPIFTLRTLPEREWSCGLAEIVKHSFLKGGDYFQKISQSKRNEYLPGSDLLLDAIDGSVQIKSEVVSQDEKEGGIRAILNLGHTTGHAIESLTQYKKYSHGEAVAIGIVTALLLSKEILNFSKDYFLQAISIMKSLELPTDLSEKPENILKHMEHDKKKDGSEIKFVLLSDFGASKYGVPISRDRILKTLMEHKSGAFYGQ
ncbi:MAG: 3-dehydroquinate synthase [Leptospira sp.]|nr:3-dehydroquinate synthase [Leptospira sp.]